MLTIFGTTHALTHEMMVLIAAFAAFVLGIITIAVDVVRRNRRKIEAENRPIDTSVFQPPGATGEPALPEEEPAPVRTEDEAHAPDAKATEPAAHGQAAAQKRRIRRLSSPQAISAMARRPAALGEKRPMPAMNRRGKRNCSPTAASGRSHHNITVLNSRMRLRLKAGQSTPPRMSPCWRTTSLWTMEASRRLSPMNRKPGP